MPALVLLVLLLLANPADAGPLDAPGYRTAFTCSACHGFGGNSRSDSVPVLAGMAPTYFKKALQDYAGGVRPSPDSPNDAWRNSAFRGYADHLASDEFATGLARLLALLARKRTVLMCAEVLWWRCHRSLVADVLQVRGFQVLHILGEQPATEHPYTAPARLFEGRLSYREGQGRLLNEAARQRGEQGKLPL